MVDTAAGNANNGELGDLHTPILDQCEQAKSKVARIYVECQHQLEGCGTKRLADGGYEDAPAAAYREHLQRGGRKLDHSEAVLADACCGLSGSESICENVRYQTWRVHVPIMRRGQCIEVH